MSDQCKITTRSDANSIIMIGESNGEDYATGTAMRGPAGWACDVVWHNGSLATTSTALAMPRHATGSSVNGASGRSVLTQN